MSRRTDRLARAIREVVSTTILFDMRDPRVKNVTVLDVDVAGDLRTAKVHVSVLGDERTESLALHGLNSARGYLQSKIGDRVELRYTPVLSFEIDDSVKKSLEASRILREIEKREGPFNPESEEAHEADTESESDESPTSIETQLEDAPAGDSDATDKTMNDRHAD